MKKVWLIGADGQLGQSILDLNAPRLKIVSTTQKEVDICNHNNVRNFMSLHDFDLVINCAAYTAVDLAETHKELANNVNNLAVENINAICKNAHAFLIHISTDFVFDGTQNSPINENQWTNPIQVYGETKLKGELHVKNGIIVRTSWLYSSYRKNFLNTMLNLGKERDEISVVIDQIGSPTHAKDLAKALLYIAKLPNLEEHVGVYHYSNEGTASWFDFAQNIMNIAKLNCKVQPILAKQYPTLASRPKYSVLDKSKIKNHFDIPIPYWRDSLKECIKEIKNDRDRY